MILIIGGTYQYYVAKKTVPEGEEQKLGLVTNLVYNKYYVDEIYNVVITKPLDWISNKAYRWIEINIIDALVNGVGASLNLISSTLKNLQTGNIGFYIFSMVVGIILMMAFKFMM